MNADRHRWNPFPIRVHLRLSAVSIALLSLCLAASTQAAEVTFDFENENHGWVSATTEATVTLAHGADRVKTGSGCLELAYPGKAGEIVSVASPDLSIEGTASVEIWVRTSVPAVLAAFLEEKDGSRYEYAFSTSPDRWQRVQASLDDFTLSQDSEDENGALNPEQVRRLSILDAGLLLAGNADLGKLFPLTPGARKLWLDDVRFRRETAPPRHPAEQVIIVDSFDGDVLRGLPILGAKAELTKVDGAGVLNLTYTPGQHELDIAGVALTVAGKRFAGSTLVRLRMRSVQAVKIGISMEERDGSRYFALTDLPAGPEWHVLELPLSTFNVTPDTTDENNRLDISQVKTIAIVDASAFAGGALEKENRITLDEILLVGRLATATK